MESIARAPDAFPARASATTTDSGDPHSVSGAPGDCDSLKDGFPDAVRIVRPEDRSAFVHWLTFLAEAQHYNASPEASAEIHDCAGLIPFAFRNALIAHNGAWRRTGQAGKPAPAENQHFAVAFVLAVDPG